MVNDPNKDLVHRSDPTAAVKETAPEQANSSNVERPTLSVEVPSITTPKGGGAISGIGEKFQANPVTGTGSMTVPIALSQGRNGFTPQLALSYDSGNGNGAFGMGWNIALPSIYRKTQKGLPKYHDDIESDIFLLAGSEDLVPELKNENGNWTEVTRAEGTFSIKSYRPRVEGLFAKIEKYTDNISGIAYWQVTTKDNITSVYGKTVSARIFDPAHPTRIFQWLLEYTFDEKGNITYYEYKQENSDGLDMSSLHEKNRLKQGLAYNQKYLKQVSYTPDIPFNEASINFFSNVKWRFQLVFDYGEHDLLAPAPGEVNQWAVRQDPFSSYRSGFEVRTYRLCRRILCFHHFENDLGAAPYLVKSTNLTYHENPVATQVQSIQHHYYEQGKPGQAYPPVTFKYNEAIIDPSLHEYPISDAENLPYGVDGKRYRWTDLEGEGLPGVLIDDKAAWYYKNNLGDENYYVDLPVNESHAPQARLASVRQLNTKPSLANLQNGPQQITDVDGNGKLDLLINGPQIHGYYAQDENGQWKNFRAFEQNPNIDWNDPNLRLIDIDGDGFADIMITRENCFTCYPSLAERGYGESYETLKSFDEEHGPNIIFADADQTIYLADMSGDGLIDIVQLKNASVAYWPNLGYGRFGHKVSMDNSPLFDHDDLFDQRRIRLGDIDGSGTTDIVYVAEEEIRYYPNASGNRLGDAICINQRIPIHDLTNIALIDLLGSGTQCLVWSSPVVADHPPAIKFVDLMSHGKPYLITEVNNNMGGLTRFKYAPSTKFYLRDKRNNTPWITKLPFPVQVVERVELWDEVNRNRFVTRYAYHHGYFDGNEREFRGFGMVEQWDTETFTDFTNEGLFPPGYNAGEEVLHVPPVHTKTWFHTGYYEAGKAILGQYEKEYYQGDAQAVSIARDIPGLLPGTLNSLTTLNNGSTATLREAARALKGSPLRQEVYSQDGSPQQEHPYVVTENNYTLKMVQPRAEAERRDRDYASFLVTPGETLSYQYERNPADPRVTHQLVLTTDVYGHVLKSATVGYARRTSQGYTEQDTTLITFTENTVINVDDNPNFYRLGVPAESRNYQFHPITAILAPTPGSPALTPKQLLNDLNTAASISFETIPDGSLQKRLIDHSRILYYNEGLTAPLSEGQVASHGLPYKAYQLAVTNGLLTGVLNEASSRVDLTTLNTGGYIDLLSDGNYWLASGKVVFDPLRFYLPTAQDDPFDNRSLIGYDTYDLMVAQVTDAIGNISQATHDYRVLQARVLTDPNGNRQEYGFDVRGMVKAMAVMGKVSESAGDTIIDPTVTFDYDLFRWSNEQQPNYVKTEARVKHASETSSQNFQLDNTYQLNLSVNGANEPGWIDLKGMGFVFTDSTDFVIDGAKTLHIPASGWLPGGSNGAVTGNDSGVFSDAILGTYFAGNSGAGNWMEFRGLDIYKRYDIDFLAGRIAGGNTNRTHNFTITGATTEVISNYNAADNTNTLGQVEKMQPDANGVIRITDQLVGDTFWRMNALVLREYSIQKSVEETYAYSDGSGQVIMTKIRSANGDAFERDAQGNLVWDVNGELILSFTNTRWISSGRTIVDNKGNPIKQYEPYYSSTEAYESEAELVEYGVTPVIRYDPLGRAIRTDLPDDTFTKVEFDPWQQKNYDQNDTVLESLWYVARNSPDPAGAEPADPEERAAWLAAKHAGTPQVVHMDALGRPFITIDDNGPDGQYVLTNTLDIKGNTTQIMDAKGRTSFTYAYDMSNQVLKTTHLDNGTRYSLLNTVGNPLRAWDSRDRLFIFQYDALQRPTHSWVHSPIPVSIPGSPGGPSIDAGKLFTLNVYGEGLNDPIKDNHRGQLFLTFDASGMTCFDKYDFKGQLWREERQLALQYTDTPDWSSLNGITNPGTVKTSAATLLESETFTQLYYRDALARITQWRTPVGGNFTPSYNTEGRLFRIYNKVSTENGANTLIVGNINFNARGQREEIDYANGTQTNYMYDEKTFRLKQIRTTRNAGSDVLQELNYTYDPVGNITEVVDNAQQTIYFNNAQVNPKGKYSYDALYRLLSAEGREFASNNSAPLQGDLAINPLPDTNAAALRIYAQSYEYDELGNILKMIHSATGGSWTRHYHYAANNYLLSTSSDGIQPTLDQYTHDAHGNMTAMPHLAAMDWDEADRLRRADLGGGGMAYYLHNNAGERIRKVIENGNIKEERIYIGLWEVYRKTVNGTLQTERRSAHVKDDQGRIVLIDELMVDGGVSLTTPTVLYRFHLGNHLGSALLE
ncbi:hypothetical protein FNH22_30570, partial [Fulvivirga sp. M361]|uniref:SpvB/TcaC N-terminal domain-containing protein n=1 Tax=Fulvivirga sp. M361 TaxID=2594266 RepID=UPI001194DBB0